MKLLGEVLKENNMITDQQLGIALKEQKGTGELMGDVFVRLGIITRKDLAWAMARCSDLDYVDLRQTFIEPEAIKAVPSSLAKKYTLIPFALDGEKIRVAMDNPNNVVALDTLRQSTRKNIEVFASDYEGIMEAIEIYYAVGTTIEEEIDKNVKAALAGAVAEGETAPPVVRLVDLFLIKAIRDGATDIHITPEERITRVNFRVDGILRSETIFPRDIHIPIVTRIKVMSTLNIAESRLPQEGGLVYEFSGREIDVRTSTSPTDNGENIVMRVLDKANVILGLRHLGLNENGQKTVRRMAGKPHGIVLSAGPTGSGKTTTLYSMLKEINAMEKNILTIEDPIEYHLPLIKQTQVNEQSGLTFKEAIRHFLRQDPDIILVGEIRDLETAKIAFQAAMTGHLVFSTIHTNDAASTIARLLDLGVEPYLIPTCMRAVLAQRLIRKICPDCVEAYTPTDEEIENYGLQNWAGAGKTLKRGRGCPRCSNMGYRGRTGIFEIMEVTPAISNLITQRASADVLVEAAREEGMLTLRDDALRWALEGVTTLDEVFRIT